MSTNELPLIGRDYPHSIIRDELCLVHEVVLNIDKAMAKEGKAVSYFPAGGYGFLEIESEKLPGRAALFIWNKVDAINLWKISEERQLKNGEELAVIWTDGHYSHFLYKLLGRFMPRLWVMVFHKGRFDWQRQKKSLDSYQGSVPYQDFMFPITDIKPPTME